MTSDTQQNSTLEPAAAESASVGRPGPAFRVIRGIGSAIWNLILPVLLALTFFLLITPYGFIYRLISGDPMDRKFEAGSSYRITSKKAPASSLEKPS